MVHITIIIIIIKIEPTKHNKAKPNCSTSWERVILMVESKLLNWNKCVLSFWLLQRNSPGGNWRSNEYKALKFNRFDFYEYPKNV